ncbi:MAG: PadR family transcriptional regulator [Candidatus Bathyarchaeota archaeon]|nr:PadR family transcriptional regulator [Candidatus Bathyarchaeota archaeon]
MQDMSITEPLSSRAVKDIEDHIIKKLLDIIILKTISEKPLTGYGIITIVHREYGVLLCAGTVYSLLHSLEKRHAIKAEYVNNTKYYTLSEKGEDTLGIITSNRNRIRNTLNKVI